MRDYFIQMIAEFGAQQDVQLVLLRVCAAAVLLPPHGAAMDVWFEADEETGPDLARGEGVRPVSSAAAPAVPLPANGSRNVPPGGVTRRTK